MTSDSLFEDLFLENRYEEQIDEGYLRDEPDIYYNKKKFDDGEINLCFITGLSGSGKSTMGADIQKRGLAIHTDLDDVVYNCNLTDEDVKKYNELYASFFLGPGKKYREIEPTHKNIQQISSSVTKDFVKYAENYAKSHKDIKFVLDGVWLFYFIDPASLKDYAVYIKGTSAIKSMYRRIKRDGLQTDLKWTDKIKTSSRLFRNYLSRVAFNESKVDKYRAYFNKLMENQKKNEFVESLEVDDIIPVDESLLKDEPDIYYNKKKFDSGEINVCFITGLSGSGKSTMGADIQKKGIAIHTDLDDVVYSIHKTDEYCAEYNDIFAAFFASDGKKYRTEEAKKKSISEVAGPIIKDFVNFALKYAKSHKDQRYVIDGTWIFCYIEPSKIKDYAVYIKGTSAIKSMLRRLNRDVVQTDKKIQQKIANGATITKNYLLHMKVNEAHVDRYRRYFTKLEEEQKKNITHEDCVYADPDFGYITEMSFSEYIDLMRKWKTSNINHKKQVFKSTSITDDQYEKIKTIIDRIKTADNYEDYKVAFDKLCKIAHCVPRGTIITKYELRKGSKQDNNTFIMVHSNNTRKIELPKGTKLYHITPVTGIKQLIPQFRGKSEKGYLYDKPRVYFTIYKAMPKINADYGPFRNVHKYVCKKDITTVYVDPLIWDRLSGAVYVESRDPIDVEEVGMKAKTSEEKDKAKSYKEQFIDMMVEMGIEPCYDDDDTEPVDEGFIKDFIERARKSRKSKVEKYVKAHKEGRSNESSKDMKRIKDSRDIVFKNLEALVSKFNQDQDIKESIRDEIDEYSKDYMETFNDHEELHDEMCGFENSGTPSFCCDEFDFYQKNGELVVTISDYSQDLNVIMNGYIRQIGKELKQIPEIKKDKLIDSISYGDGDEGCMYIQLNPAPEPEPQQESVISVEDTIFNNLFDEAYYNEYAIFFEGTFTEEDIDKRLKLIKDAKDPHSKVSLGLKLTTALIGFSVSGTNAAAKSKIKDNIKDATKEKGIMNKIKAGIKGSVDPLAIALTVISIMLGVAVSKLNKSEIDRLEDLSKKINKQINKCTDEKDLETLKKCKKKVDDAINEYYESKKKHH